MKIFFCVFFLFIQLVVLSQITVTGHIYAEIVESVDCNGSINILSSKSTIVAEFTSSSSCLKSVVIKNKISDNFNFTEKFNKIYIQSKILSEKYIEYKGDLDITLAYN